ncbi:MAG: type III pantothenate kinase [Burkholderiales bacterium]
MSVLLLDAGNTRLKWGLHDDTGWLAQDTLDYARIADLPQAVAAHGSPDRALGANVAGERVRTTVEAALADARVALAWNAPAREQCGVRSSYGEPAQLGADRWAAVIGARALSGAGAAAVVVNAGTAVTVDALTADGVFLGGLILPGLTLMRDALAEGTAQLPRADGTFAFFPANTADAIASGALNAACGAIERMADYLEASGGVAPLIVLSGGDAARLVPHLAVETRLVDNLVLEGLWAVAQHNNAAPATPPR